MMTCDPAEESWFWGDQTGPLKGVNVAPVRRAARPGRNRPCPCGSRRKYKTCGLRGRCNDEEATVAQLNTCGSCSHWRKLPADPNNLGQPPRGECREQLHSAMVPTQTPMGVALQVIPYYPQVAAANPACSRFKAALALGGAYDATAH